VTMEPRAEASLQVIRIIIVDDSRLVREGIASLIGREPDIDVVASSTDGREALDIVERHRPVIVLAGASTPERRGVALAREIARKYSDVRVVVMGLPEDPLPVTEAIEAGAAGYVVQEASVEDLVDVIRLVGRGETQCSPKIAAAVFSSLAELAAARRASDVITGIRLTPREVQILGLVAEGLTNKEIAARLHVATQTVKNHMHNILDKLKLKHRLEAVQYATEAGILRRPPFR